MLEKLKYALKNYKISFIMSFLFLVVVSSVLAIYFTRPELLGIYNNSYYEKVYSTTYGEDIKIESPLDAQFFTSKILSIEEKKSELLKFRNYTVYQLDNFNLKYTKYKRHYMKLSGDNYPPTKLEAQRCYTKVKYIRDMALKTAEFEKYYESELKRLSRLIEISKKLKDSDRIELTKLCSNTRSEMKKFCKEEIRDYLENKYELEINSSIRYLNAYGYVDINSESFKLLKPLKPLTDDDLENFNYTFKD